MSLASSPAFHDQPAVHPHEPGHFLTTSLAGGVVSHLRHRSCRTFGAFLDRLGCRRPIDLTSCLALPIRQTGCP